MMWYMYLWTRYDLRSILWRHMSAMRVSDLRLFVQQLVRSNSKESIKAPYYWPCEGNRRWLIDSPQKGQLVRKTVSLSFLWQYWKENWHLFGFIHGKPGWEFMGSTEPNLYTVWIICLKWWVKVIAPGVVSIFALYNELTLYIVNIWRPLCTSVNWALIGAGLRLSFRRCPAIP